MGSRKDFAQQKICGKKEEQAEKSCSLYLVQTADNKPCSDVVEIVGVEPANFSMQLKRIQIEHLPSRFMRRTPAKLQKKSSTRFARVELLFGVQSACKVRTLGTANLQGSRKDFAQQKICGKKEEQAEKSCSLYLVQTADNKPCSDVVEIVGVEPANFSMQLKRIQIEHLPSRFMRRTPAKLQKKSSTRFLRVELFFWWR